MTDEPTNAAAEFARWGVGMLNDEEFMRRDGLSLVTRDFLRYDRRRLTPQPPADREAWLAAFISLAEVSGSWPVYSISEVLAVRGERLVVYRMLARFGDGAEIEFVALQLSDEPIERAELVIFFDPEDIDLAIEELDRLHDELTRG